MNKIIYKSLLFLAAAGVFTGCIEETFPQGGSQTESQVSKNDMALKAMLNSIPAAMMTSNTAGYASTYDDHTDFGIGGIFLRNEFMLEDMATMGDNPYYNRFYSYALCEGMGQDYIACAYYWDCYYAWIKTTNDIISLIPEGATGEVETIKGQAHAFRASFYLDLARLYEPKGNGYVNVPENIKGLTVPIITGETDEKTARNNPRAKRETMYEFILSDLKEAEKCLKGKEVGYTMPGEHAVNVLYARTYLEMGAADVEDGDADKKASAYYEKALEYAQKVIDGSGKSPLTQAQWEDPKTGFNKGDANQSWIWGLTSNSENQKNIVTYIAHISSEAQWGYCTLSHIGISKSLYELISDKDWRKHSWLDPRRFEFYNYKFAGTEEDKNNLLNGNPALQLDAIKDYQSLKFRPNNGNATNFTEGNAADLVLMRIEELYFIKAEALAGLGRLSEAASTLNELVNTRYSDQSYDCSGKAGDPHQFLDELLLQKRIEFWGEGILLYDYKRLNHGITRAYSGSNHAAVYALNCEGRSPQWNMVITRGECQSNTAVINNPDPSKFVEPTPID